MKSIVYFPKATVMAVLLTALPSICFASPFSKIASARESSEIIATAARHKADFPADKNVLHAEKNVLHAEKNVLQADMNVVPAEKNVVPAEKNVVPAEKAGPLETDYQLKPTMPALEPSGGLRISELHFELKPQPTKEELDKLIDRNMADRFRVLGPPQEVNTHDGTGTVTATGPAAAHANVGNGLSLNPADASNADSILNPGLNLKVPRLSDAEYYRYNGVGPKLNLQMPQEERFVDLRRRLDRAVTVDLKLGETPFQLSLNTRRCNMRSRVGLCFSLKTD